MSSAHMATLLKPEDITDFFVNNASETLILSYDFNERSPHLIFNKISEFQNSLQNSEVFPAVHTTVEILTDCCSFLDLPKTFSRKNYSPTTFMDFLRSFLLQTVFSNFNTSMHANWLSVFLQAVFLNFIHTVLIDLHRLHDVKFTENFTVKKSLILVSEQMEETENLLLVDETSPFCLNFVPWGKRLKMIKFFCASTKSKTYENFDLVRKHYRKHCRTDDSDYVSDDGSSVHQWQIDVTEKAHLNQQTGVKLDDKVFIQRQNDKIPSSDYKTPPLLRINTTQSINFENRNCSQSQDQPDGSARPDQLPNTSAFECF